MKLRAIVAEEAVFSSGPEVARLVLDEFKDIVIFKTFVLIEVLKGELLCVCLERAEEKGRQGGLEEPEREGRSKDRRLGGSVGPGQDVSLLAQ